MYMHVVPSAAVSDTPQPQVTQTQYSLSQSAVSSIHFPSTNINQSSQSTGSSIQLKQLNSCLNSTSSLNLIIVILQI